MFPTFFSLAVSLIVSVSFAAPSVIPPSKELLPRAVSCPADFRNVVFNTGAPKSAGWPTTIWNSLTSNGVSDFIAFTDTTLDKTATYNLASGAPAPTTCELDDSQILICMDPRYTGDALSLITGPNPPEYLELFNEPDYSYEGFTPLTSPQAAASSLTQILAATTSTQLISPAVAFTNTNYLSDFNTACNGCLTSKINIISMHLYNPLVDQAMLQITTLHNTWPNAKIWITELAPASSSNQGCTLDEDGMVSWMTTLLPQIVALGYVERVFWNSGEYGTIYSDNPTMCNPSLTNPDGSPTALLTAYGGICS